MSFSSDVKLELCKNDTSTCCKKAFIGAIIKMNSNLGISNKQVSINITFENVSIIRYIYEMIKQLYQVESQIIVTTQMKFKKHNQYTIKLIDHDLKILN
ncbi:MAG: DNA-binding protein WhiA, partial [Bacilli bacterium]